MSTPRHANDLLRRIGVAQDRAALTELFGLFAGRIKSYLIRQGAPPAAAEELTQETFLSVWRKAHLFDPDRGAASTWMFVIARNCRIDALRRERLDLAYDDALPQVADEADGPEKQASDADMARGVRAAIATLSPEQQEVVALSFFEDKPHSEIAEQLGLPLGTVKSRLRLAMKHLRAHLDSNPESDT